MSVTSKWTLPKRFRGLDGRFLRMPFEASHLRMFALLPSQGGESDLADAFPGQADSPGGCFGQINTSPLYEWPAVVNLHDYRTAVRGVGYPDQSAEWQSARGGRKIVLIEDLPAASAIALETGSVPRSGYDPRPRTNRCRGAIDAAHRGDRRNRWLASTKYRGCDDCGDQRWCKRAHRSWLTHRHGQSGCHLKSTTKAQKWAFPRNCKMSRVSNYYKLPAD